MSGEKEDNTYHDLGRGVIRDSAIKAAVTSKLFRVRVVKSKKGKGSYSRRYKIPYLMVSLLAIK